MPGNLNGNMSRRVYIETILEAVVKPWLEAGKYFALDEDVTSGHGSGKGRIILHGIRRLNVG